MAGFAYRKSMGSSEEPTLLYFIVNNSEVISVGDAVKVDASGNAILAIAGSTIAGVVHQVVDKNGIVISPNSSTSDTYTMAADNETVNQYQVGVDVSPRSLYSNDSDGALAATNLFQFFDLVSESQIDQSSASDASGSFQLVGLDPDGDADVSKGLFRVAESQLNPYAQQ